MSLYFELPFCISESRFLGLPEEYGLSFNIRNSLPKVLSYILYEPADEGESRVPRGSLYVRLSLRALPRHVFGSLEALLLWLCACRVGQNLIDSFSQGFEQVVRSRCRCYSFRAAFVLIALR